LIKTLKALADENRLKILHMLLVNDLCVGALAKQLGISKPAVSQHLQILRKAGLVKGEKRGYWTHYVVDRYALRRIALELNNLAMVEEANGSVCWRIIETFESKAKLEKEASDRCRNAASSALSGRKTIV